MNDDGAVDAVPSQLTPSQAYAMAGNSSFVVGEDGVAYDIRRFRHGYSQSQYAQQRPRPRARRHSSTSVKCPVCRTTYAYRKYSSVGNGNNNNNNNNNSNAGDSDEDDSEGGYVDAPAEHRCSHDARVVFCCSGQKCPVCLEDNESIMVALRCGHLVW